MIHHPYISEDHNKNLIRSDLIFEGGLKIGVKYLFYYRGYIPGSLVGS